MAEELNAGICGETWWNSSKTMFAGRSYPCPTGIAVDMGSFGWGADMVDMKASSSYEESEDSLAFQLGAQQGDSDKCGTSILLDSTLQMMGFGLPSSSTSDWNQSLIRSNGRSEGYDSILQQVMDSCQTQKDWSPRSYASRGEDSSITTFKPINQDFSLEQQRLNSVTSSGNSTATCQFPMDSVSYGYTSTLSQTLFQSDPQTQQQSLFHNNRSINYMSAAATDGTICGTESSPSWPKLAPLLRSSLPKQPPKSILHFTKNNAPFWNASAAGVNDVKAGFLPSRLQSEFLLQSLEKKPSCPGLTKMTNTEEARKSGSTMKKGLSSETTLLKRPRIETPSPLPALKVRKEKLGDRITALQQLVSPFGKTDTASVLHEAIEYIKFLHEQVDFLSTPYMKQAAASVQQQQSTESPERDLRSLGLCLVPISSTFPVANETTVDFWTPTFGGLSGREQKTIK
ncbi:bHLH114 protein [Hibiscus syriacus]|uniref:BHLH114 protein n=1 Tax=Hibiscus syriacus TaxID=106335 RepID=A0A6A2WFW2_HIBSY|nr:transcription factor bHLH112-like [Hibiscus syriacus]KAE8656541.1 bHLH114 protein [Hibiscus syriacus]